MLCRNWTTTEIDLIEPVMFTWTKQQPVLLPSACEQHWKLSKFRINIPLPPKKNHFKHTVTVVSACDYIRMELFVWLATSLSTTLCIWQFWKRFWKREEHQVWKLIGVLGMLRAFLITTILSGHFQLQRNQWKFKKWQHLFTSCMCANRSFCCTWGQGWKPHGLPLSFSTVIALGPFQRIVWVTDQAWSGSVCLKPMPSCCLLVWQWTVLVAVLVLCDSIKL